VRKAFDDDIGNFRFRRVIVGAKKSMSTDLKKLCENNHLFGGLGYLVLAANGLLTESGQFATKSFYIGLHNFGAIPHKFLWKTKLHLVAAKKC
jgi:hypothetical protein